MANSGLYLRYALHRVVSWLTGSFILSVERRETFFTWLHRRNSTRQICSPESAQLPRLRAPVWFSSLRMSNITSKVLRWPNMGCPDEWPLSPLPNNPSQLVKPDPGGPGFQPMSPQKRALVAFEGRFPQRFLVQWEHQVGSFASLFNSNMFSTVVATHKTLSESKNAERQTQQNLEIYFCLLRRTSK